jgi:hypothetical protein
MLSPNHTHMVVTVYILGVASSATVPSGGKQCIVGFSDPRFMWACVLVGKRGGPSRPVFCVDYESEVGLPTRILLWRPQVAENGSFYAWE